MARVKPHGLRDENLALVLAPGALEGTRADIGRYARRLVAALAAVFVPLTVVVLAAAFQDQLQLTRLTGAAVLVPTILLFAFGLPFTLVFAWKLIRAVGHRNELERMMRQRNRL